ncbi:hypothetical protein [Flavobacterium rhizosphaerae]|uniref:Uncharacterized protein n=1 Tax=Flavobacterium rhizosphaerae TaxID=3163298 RepID=A0ABW8YXQ3_9FLAO
MKKTAFFIMCVITAFQSVAQNNSHELKMISDSDNPQLQDILMFEGIDYYKIKFSGKDLKGKTYKITVKEIKDGITVSDSVFYDSSSTDIIEQFRKINDTVFEMRVLGRHTTDNKLKMSFFFPQYMFKKEFDALPTDEYSLRNLAQESGLPIEYGKKFYLLAYILPYETPYGKSWCDIGHDGKDVEQWGKKFGIKHYILFEMEFK